MSLNPGRFGVYVSVVVRATPNFVFAIVVAREVFARSAGVSINSLALTARSYVDIDIISRGLQRFGIVEDLKALI